MTWVTSLTLTQAWFPPLAIAFGGNGVAWSLSVEAFFYLLFPLAWIVLSHLQSGSRRAVAFGCAALVTLAGAAPDTWRWAVYVFPVARLPEFIIGMVTALAVRDGWRPRLWPPLVALVPAGVVAYAVATPARYDYEFATIICFALLVPALAAKELEGRPGLLATRRMVALGSASYALYLFHQLVFRGLAVVVSNTNLAIGPHAPDPLKVAVAAIAIALALAVAEVVHRRIEIPMQRRLQGKRLNDRSTDIDRAGGPDSVVVLDPPGG
jgi:peptidoglycan/LPS O-acetylase OafA/YrhL